MALRLPKQTWLFEAGEDSQRQLVQQPILNQGRVCRIFISSCDAHNLFGLPGWACLLAHHLACSQAACLPGMMYVLDCTNDVPCWIGRV